MSIVYFFYLFLLDKGDLTNYLLIYFKVYISIVFYFFYIIFYYEFGGSGGYRLFFYLFYLNNYLDGVFFYLVYFLFFVFKIIFLGPLAEKIRGFLFLMFLFFGVNVN